jgi:hypothetical protein
MPRGCSPFQQRPPQKSSDKRMHTLEGCRERQRELSKHYVHAHTNDDPAPPQAGQHRCSPVSIVAAPLVPLQHRRYAARTLASLLPRRPHWYWLRQHCRHRRSTAMTGRSSTSTVGIVMASPGLIQPPPAPSQHRQYCCSALRAPHQQAGRQPGRQSIN